MRGGARASGPAPLLAGDGETRHGADVGEVGVVVPGLVPDGLHPLPGPLQRLLRAAHVDVRRATRSPPFVARSWVLVRKVAGAVYVSKTSLCSTLLDV